MRLKKIGTRAMFLIPSVKVYEPKHSKSGQNVARAIHTFLKETFGGYTCASGNIYGYYTSASLTQYDELREFRVSFDTVTCIKPLATFLASLAEDIGEECIYFERGSEVFYVYPN